MSGHQESMSQDEDNQGEEGDYQLNSFLDISNKKFKMEDEDEKPTSVSKRRVQRYRPAWETYPDFAPWIRSVESDNMSAQCTVCNSIMKAEITVLKRHCFSAKHLHNMDLAGSGETVRFSYRKEWEKNKQLMDWVGPVVNNDKEANCTVCQINMNAIISELKLHMRSETHQKNMADKVHDDFYQVKPKTSTRKVQEKISLGNFSFQIPHDNTSDIEVDEEYILEEENELERFDNLSIAEDTEVHTEEASETPIRVYRVKPTSVAASPVPRNTISRNVLAEETAKALVTQPAPFWKGKAVVNGHVQEQKLSDYRGRYLVMFFYPQDFATVCSTEILALGDVISAFRVVNCEVIAVSVDSHLAHLAWTKTLSSSHSNEKKTIVPLLSDASHSISKAYGCYLESAGHSLRAYYIIDKRGILRSMNITDVQVGRNLKEILRLVEAFQLVDSTNTQCPVNWTMGQPSVKVAL